MADYAVMPLEDYQKACDAIRVRTGETDPIKSGELATEIENIPYTKDWTGTQAAYDAMASHDPETTYYIIEE